jgi:hypothetical protein
MPVQSHRDRVLQSATSTGLRPSAQGCEGRATLGKIVERNYNPFGVDTLSPSSQGGSSLATFGFVPESLWDSRCLTAPRSPHSAPRIP